MSRYAHADADSVGQRTRKGIQLTSVSQLARFGLQFATQLVLTRLIAPSQFGLVAMAAVLTGFAATLAESGTQAAIVQRKDLREANLSAALLLNLVIASAVAGALVVLAPLIADFYDAPEVRTLVWILTPGFVIAAVGVVHRGLLERQLRFRAIAVIDVAASVVASVASIALALAGFGARAIVANSVALAVVTTLLSWAAVRWFPRALPTRQALREILGFSGHYLTFNVINYWTRNLDNLLVGKFFGPLQAGLYTRAYSLLLVPLTQVSAVYGRVMLASLSSIQDNLGRVREAYLNTVAEISSLTTPLLLGLVLVAGDVVPLALGEQWRPAVGMIRIFALLGILQVLTTTIGWIFLSQGRPQRMLVLSLFNTALILASFFIGVAIGSAFAVAVCYAVASLIVIVPNVWVGFGQIDLPVSAMAKRLAPSFLAAAAMVPTTLITHVALADVAPILRLLAETLVGAATYAFAGRRVGIPVVENVLALRRPGRRPELA